ncbi:MAG: hypothetical protein IT385_27770 [Deltaproteobacteria bacterium]|nr:hypothetical protein [Deltaproteobacteria bacterium]
MDLSTFIARPAWPVAEVAALPGRGKGSLMRDWAVHIERRRGRAAVEQIRAATGISAAELPDQPPKDAWVRIAWQCQLTRAVADLWFGGDLAALEPALREDAIRARDRWIDRVLRATISPRRILAAGARIHATLYDVGAVVTDVDKRRAHIAWRGARFMAEPTWGALQAFAIRGLFAATNHPEPRIEATPGDEGLTFDVYF